VNLVSIWGKSSFGGTVSYSLKVWSERQRRKQSHSESMIGEGANTRIYCACGRRLYIRKSKSCELMVPLNNSRETLSMGMYLFVVRDDRYAFSSLPSLILEVNRLQCRVRIW
jgi:hypothetical protein